MAIVTKGRTWGASETVTNVKLNDHVDDATVTDIVQADIIAASGLAVRSATAPSDTDAIWVDTSVSPPDVKRHDGSDWVRIGDKGGTEGFNNLLRNGSFESWSAGATAAPDSWILSGAGATVAKDTTNTKHGAAAVGLTRVGNDVGLTYNVPTSFLGSANYIQGRTFTLAVWVRATVASRARITLSDNTGGTSSAFHTGGSSYELLTVTRTMDGAATSMNAAGNVVTGDTVAQFDGAILVEGTAAIAFSPHPNDQHLRISNFQAVAPADNTDQGVFRSEIGQAAFTGNTGVSLLNLTITFETAFRTTRIAHGTADADIGSSAVIVYSQSLTTSSFQIQVRTADEANFGSTNAGNVFWSAIGQV